MSDSSTEASASTESTASTTSDVSAEASTATQGAGSMLDAVREAVGQSAEASPTSGTENGTSATPSEDGGEAPDPDELSAEEQARLSTKAQARFRHLSSRAKELEAQVGEFQEKAGRFDQLAEFVTTNNIAPPDIDAAFRILVNIQRNPQRALEQLTPIYQQLQQLAGDVLPEDLQEQVRLGYISEAHAKELNKLKAGQTVRSEIDRRDAEQAETRRQREAWDTRVGTVRDAINTWEDQQKARDPDWPLKAQRLNELLRLHAHENGLPETGEAAVALANDLLKKVKAEHSKFLPARKAVTHVAGETSTRTVAEPKTMLEAIRAAI